MACVNDTTKEDPDTHGSADSSGEDSTRATEGEVSHGSPDATTFLFGQPASTDTPAVPTSRRDNIYRHPPQDTKVEIKVGSIHSMKGETHTATLVLDTFYVKHHLLMLKPWLLRARSGGGSEKKTLLSRLRQHYVAMTRPSHLLCLAMREDCLTKSDMDQLKTLGWRVARVQNAGNEWLWRSYFEA